MIGIAFEGCACKAAFHVGVAAALDEARLAIGLTAGASSGSLVAVGLASGRAHELPKLWRALAGRSVVSFRRAFWNRSIFDMSDIVRSAIVASFGVVDLRDRPVEALVVATRLWGLQPVVYSSRTEPAMLEPILGSCFVPVMYGRPIRVRGDWLLDGGLTDNLPIETLTERGADEIIAVIASHSGTALKSVTRPRWRPEAPGRRLHVVHPERPLAIGSWDFSADAMNRAIDDGYEVGRRLVGR